MRGWGWRPTLLNRLTTKPLGASASEAFSFSQKSQRADAAGAWCCREVRVLRVPRMPHCAQRATQDCGCAPLLRVPRPAARTSSSYLRKGAHPQFRWSDTESGYRATPTPHRAAAGMRHRGTATTRPRLRCGGSGLAGVRPCAQCPDKNVQARKNRRPCGTAVFPEPGIRLLAGGSRSGVSSGRSRGVSGGSRSSFRSSRSRGSGRSRGSSGSSFFSLLAASGQGSSSQQGSQQDRLIHTCPQDLLDEDSITGNSSSRPQNDCVQDIDVRNDSAHDQLGRTRRGNLERFPRLARNYSVSFRR